VKDKPGGKDGGGRRVLEGMGRKYGEACRVLTMPFSCKGTPQQEKVNTLRKKNVSGDAHSLRRGKEKAVVTHSLFPQ